MKAPKAQLTLGSVALATLILSPIAALVLGPAILVLAVPFLLFLLLVGLYRLAYRMRR